MSNSPAKMNAPLVPLSPELPNEFQDFTGSGPRAVPADTLLNSLIALKKLGIDCSYNIFRNEYLISGKLLNLDVVSELSDGLVLALRPFVRLNFSFEPSQRMMQDAVMRLCQMRTFHPVKDYLNSLPRWDGIERAGRLLPDYFNAPDTPFNRAVSRIVMMASVRRIFKPGTKFDYMTVLQSEEGYNKSSAISALYGADYFTDNSTIGLSTKEVEETLRGQWAQENAELSGISKADWNKLKAMLSRTNDRTRRVYERNPINAQRTAIQWGTSNSDAYLRALSGMNRRFFSIDVLSLIDVARIIGDRDELWAEAVELEATGDSVMLPQEFWADANIEREKRTETDPWEDILADVDKRAKLSARLAAKRGEPVPYEETATSEQRIASSYLLNVIGIMWKDWQPYHSTRIGAVMRKHGWAGPKPLRIAGSTVKGYARTAPWADLI
jgi:hypothetical protein